MDDSWQVPIGSILPSRRSAEEPRLRRRLPRGGSGAGAGSSAALDPDDFRDVFGGPPRTLLLRRFSGELRPPPGTSLYDQIFRPAAERGGGGGGEPRRMAGGGGGGGDWGRRLPGFRIPERAGMLRTEEGFYDDIFGADVGGGGGGGGGEWRTRTRSRSRSKRSSAVSSDELSPSPATTAAAAAAPREDDAVLSFYASKLRPITIPSWRHDASPPSTISVGDPSSIRSFSIPFMNLGDDNYTAGVSSSRLNQQLRPSNVNFRCFSPPETIRRTPWGGNSEPDSPPSVISSVSVDPVMPSKSAALEIEKAAAMEIDCGEDSSNTIPAESSFFIEIDGRGRRKEATEVDEAIAWAKETFWNEMRKKVEVENENEKFRDVEG